MCEKAALKEQSDNRDVQQQLERVSDPRPLESNRRVPMLGVLERGSWTRTPLGPKTPALNEEAPLQTRMDLFSSLIKERRTSLEQNMRQKSKRNLEDDFLTALDGEHTVKKESKAAEAAPVPYWDRKRLKRINKKKMKNKMPWHSWFCRGCGKKLPNGHMNCVGDLLRQFDNTMKYGPCLGITREDRWIRAFRLGLNPPDAVFDALNKTQNLQFVNRCVWEGHV